MDGLAALITSNPVIFWLIVAIAAGVIEASTAGLFSVWFAIGALVTMAPAWLGASFNMQIAVFIAASAAALNRAVGFALEEVRALSPVAGMSGSGSACYALFGTREACLAARKRYKGRFRTFCVSTLPQQYFARGTGAGE